MDLKVNGVVQSRAASLVDVSAPACYQSIYSVNGSGQFEYAASGCGTSFASPTVAGNAALLLHSFFSLGWSGMDARLTQTYLIMMGDGWAEELGIQNWIWMDEASGAGRLKNHYMGGGDLTNPWAWACHKATLSNGQEHQYHVIDSNPEPLSLSTWKAALTWREDNMDNAADIDFLVYDTCPSGGGAPQQIAWDASYDLRSRLRLTSGNAAGKCLQYRVRADHIPSGQTRQYTTCWYYQSGGTSDH